MDSAMLFTSAYEVYRGHRVDIFATTLDGVSWAVEYSVHRGAVEVFRVEVSEEFGTCGEAIAAGLCAGRAHIEGMPNRSAD